MPEYTLETAMEVLKDLNYPNQQYIVTMDNSMIFLYDVKFHKIVIKCSNPKRMFHHFFHECKKLDNNIIKCARHISHMNFERNLSPLESIWPYKNLLKYYTPEQIKCMLYEK